MAIDEHLEILAQGVLAWNKWRADNPGITPDLSDADLTSKNLSEVYPPRPEKHDPQMVFNFIGANLSITDLSRTNLSNMNLRNVDLSFANLDHANVRSSALWRVTFKRTQLRDADLSGSQILLTAFLDVDLSQALGLDDIIHDGPSFVDINSIYRSTGHISKPFLRGCGIPESLISYIPSFVGADEPLQFDSCFISYSHKDEEFAKRLQSRLRESGIRVWFAPENIKGGEKLYDQIERAIQIHDRLLLVLSHDSMQSEWVLTEIRNSRSSEACGRRRKLFPIRLVDFDTIKKWKCFDADAGKDLAIEIREYFIPDFSDWKNHVSFEAACERLIRDLNFAN